MTHIMLLVKLAPDIQVLPRAEPGPDKVEEIEARRIVRLIDWEVQRELWGGISPYHRD